MIRRLIAAAALAAALTAPAHAQLSGQVPGTLDWWGPQFATDACTDGTHVYAHIGTQTADPGYVLVWAEWTDVPLHAGNPTTNPWIAGEAKIKLTVRQLGFVRFTTMIDALDVARDPMAQDTWFTTDPLLPIDFDYRALAERHDPVTGHDETGPATPATRHVLWTAVNLFGLASMNFSWECGLYLDGQLGTTGEYGFGANKTYRGVCGNILDTITF